MPVCFTIGELYRLAEKLQVPETPTWSNNPQEASRDIVRHFERSGALAFLVEALREAKPLVEWPEPALPVPPAPPVAPTQLQAPLGSALGPDEPTFDATDRATPIVSLSDAAVLASIGARDGRPSPEPAGFAPALMPKPGDTPAPEPGAAPAPRTVLAQPSELPAIQDPMVPPASAASPTSRPAAASPGPAAWPGTVRPKPTSDVRTMDPRVLLAAGFAMLLTAVAFAFFLGRASSAGPGEPSTTTAAAELPPDHAPIAQHAAEALGTSLERVARACKIEVASLRGRSLFEVAYRRCGPLPPQPTEPRPAAVDDPPPDSDPDSAPDPAPPKKAGGAAGNKLQKVDSPSAPGPLSAAGGCLSGCSRAHSTCTSRCGAEPTQSSQYDAYQACLGGCLKAMSQCKLGCQ